MFFLNNLKQFSISKDLKEFGSFQVLLLYHSESEKRITKRKKYLSFGTIPLSPNDWKLTFDGKSVSLRLSIGNWNFECKSHYWIINNKVRIARKWSGYEIQSRRKTDFKKKKKT